MKYAVCIPTYCEEDTIVSITQRIDQGLSLCNFGESVIVNCNNLSLDRTKDRFLSVHTNNKKVYIETMNVGKGSNLLAFFRFIIENDIQYAVTLDADVESMKPDWLYKMFRELLMGADYVIPSYSRNRFEGSTTNHFAFPFVYGTTGAFIRQPIGGDFGFSRKYVKHILKQEICPEITQYGIDIFMTVSAISSRFPIAVVSLGNKIHKPSFKNMDQMSKQVMVGGLFSAQNQINSIQLIDLPFENKKTELTKGSFSHKEASEKLMKLAEENWKRYKPYVYSHLNLADRSCEIASMWEVVLSAVIKEIKNIDLTDHKLIDGIHSLFIMRAISYWEIVNRPDVSNEEAEGLILAQARAIRKKLIGEK